MAANNTPLEHVEQRNFVAWFRHNFPDVLIFAIPNGTYKGGNSGIKHKLEGVTAGVPDLFIPEWKLWIEMKRVKGSVTSRDQKEIMAELTRVGYHCEVCKGFEKAKEVTLECIKQKRITTRQQKVD